jgi:hypothetical protein
MNFLYYKTNLVMMKTIHIVLLFCFISFFNFSQKKTEIQDTTQIKKEVKMTIENGLNVLTIETTSYKNGKEIRSKEVFTGDEAESKMKDLKVENSISTSETEVKSAVWDDVRYEEIDGYKKLTIIHNENGSVTEKVFIGKEAEEKLKEIQKEK